MGTDVINHGRHLRDINVPDVDVCYWPVTASMANGRRGSFVG
jgi:hypothetical protein